jgi:hypothetical protein
MRDEPLYGFSRQVFSSSFSGFFSSLILHPSSFSSSFILSSNCPFMGRPLPNTEQPHAISARKPLISGRPAMWHGV